jgi:NADH dehydrogenase FAD-containing subunit
MHRVVIIGGGFGGLFAAKALRWIVGSATFTTVASSTTMNCGVATRTRTLRRSVLTGDCLA